MEVDAGGPLPAPDNHGGLMQNARPSTGFWGALNDRDQAALSARGGTSVFGRGEPLCIEGDPLTHLYVLLAGWAKVVRATMEGHDVVIALRGPGDIIGEMAGELDGRRTATVRAVVQVRTISVVAEHFAAFLDAHPHAERAYRHVLAERIRETADDLRARVEISGGQRLARRLLELADRCGEATQHGIMLGIPLSQVDLASWAGMSRASATRALHQWRERGLISRHHGRLTIMDVAALRRISGT